MSWTNYHSHSHYCDGKYPPEKHIKKAIEHGFYAFGCSSHAPIPFPTTWCMKSESLETYVNEIRHLQSTYKDQIEVYVGLEVDFIPLMSGPNSRMIRNAGLDYTIGSIHFIDAFPDGKPWEIDGVHTVFLDGLQAIFHNDTEAAVTRYFALIRQMVEEDCPDVVGHLDKIKMQDERGALFSEKSQWYRNAVMATLEVIRDKGIITEVNTRGIYKKTVTETYPSRWILEAMHDMGIPVMLNSDSHRPDEIDGNFEETAEMLLEIGYKKLQVLLGGEWQPVSFSPNGIQILHHG